MQGNTLEVIPMASPSRLGDEGISLVRAILFGLFVPPFLAAIGFMLLQIENLFTFLSPVSLFFTLINLYFFSLMVCAPFGVPFAMLCGLLARMLFRRGEILISVQRKLCAVGALCGFVALWGVGTVLNGRANLFDALGLPFPFWATALFVGAICGWLLPRAARLSHSITVQPAK